MSGSVIRIFLRARSLRFLRANKAKDAKDANNVMCGGLRRVKTLKHYQYAWQSYAV
jgi:hypothetical protein